MGPGPRALGPVGHLMPAALWGFALSFNMFCVLIHCFFVVSFIFFVAVSFTVVLLSRSLFFEYFPVFWTLDPGPRALGHNWPFNASRSLGICVLIAYF